MKKTKSIWLWPLGSFLAVVLVLIIALNVSQHSYRKAAAQTAAASSSSKTDASSTSAEPGSSSQTMASSSAKLSSSSQTSASSSTIANGNYYYGPGIGPSLVATVSGNQVVMDGDTYTIDAENKTFTSNGQVVMNYYYSNGFLSFSSSDSGFGFGVNDKMFNINASDNVSAGDLDGDYYYGGGDSGFSKAFTISGDQAIFSDVTVTLDFNRHIMSGADVEKNFWYSNGLLIYWSDDGSFGFGLNNRKFDVQ
ncbi:hypothetical protein [Lactovum odontotermitis]